MVYDLEVTLGQHPLLLMLNGIIYCRVSSKEQVEGTSLESQEIACREYAAQHDIGIAKVFVEEGESAKFADRTQLLALLDFCRQPQTSVSKLLVWKVDRFARNVADHYSIKADLLKHGVDVVSVTEPIDGKPEGKLLETILAGFAQFDNDLRAARTINGMRRKIQEGIFPWKPPLGYITPPRAGQKKTEHDIADDALFPSLQKAWSMYATGAYSKAEIIRLLTDWGIRTRSGAPISKQTIDNMLRDPFYAGFIRDPWSGEDHAGRHEPLVSHKVFAQIQEVNECRRKTRSVRHQVFHPDFPLRAFARCAHCEHYVTGARTRGRSKHYAYYRCDQLGCDLRQSMSVTSVNEEFITFLRSICPSPSEIGRVLKHVGMALEGRRATRKGILKTEEKELATLKTRQQRLVSMRLEEAISKEDFQRFNAPLIARINTIARPVAMYEKDGMTDRLESARKLIGNLEHTWRTLGPGPKQRFQRVVLPLGFVIGRIETAEKGCLFATIGQFRDGKSHEVPPTGQFLNRISENLSELSEIFLAAANLQDVPKLVA